MSAFRALKPDRSRLTTGSDGRSVGSPWCRPRGSGTASPGGWRLGVFPRPELRSRRIRKAGIEEGRRGEPAGMEDGGRGSRRAVSIPGPVVASRRVSGLEFRSRRVRKAGMEEGRRGEPRDPNRGIIPSEATFLQNFERTDRERKSDPRKFSAPPDRLSRTFSPLAQEKGRWSRIEANIGLVGGEIVEQHRLIQPNWRIRIPWWEPAGMEEGRRGSGQFVSARCRRSNAAPRWMADEVEPPVEQVGGVRPCGGRSRHPCRTGGGSSTVWRTKSRPLSNR